MIQYRVGSITQADQKIIAHGCNLRGKMGKGVALAIKQKWPEAFLAYEHEVLDGGAKLGDVVWARTERDSTLFEQLPEAPWVANVITQERIGNDGARYVSYDAVDVGLRRVAQRAVAELGVGEIAIPAIGTGLGGGNWRIIVEIIHAIKDVNWMVYARDEAQLDSLFRAMKS